MSVPISAPEVLFRPRLLPGRLIERRNRFLARVVIDGERTEAHVPSSGRLRELLLPGAELLLQPAPPKAGRRTPYTLVGVRHERENGNVWVCIHTGLTNRLAGSMLRGRFLPGLEHFTRVTGEVPYHDSRFDFQLGDQEGGTGWVEVKCVTLAVGDQARFPDAPTDRGARHLHHLTDLARRGHAAVVLFVAQRDDVVDMAPNRDQDPAFSEALVEAAAAGVAVHAVAASMSAERLRVVRSLPVRLEA